MMNDSAQNLEQLIRQYTQELLRFQKQYAAHMPTNTDTPNISDTNAENTPPTPDNRPQPMVPENMFSDVNDTLPEIDDTPPNADDILPEMDDLMPEWDDMFDRPLIPSNDDDRHPHTPMQDPLSAFTEPTPPFLEGLGAPEPIPDDGLPIDRSEPSNESWDNLDLMSDPDAVPPQAFPPATPTPSPASDQTDFGQLQVQVYKAGEAIPIQNATVTIFQQESNGSRTPITVTTTNRSGFTPAITVPTVSASLSLEPGHEHPYSTYLVQVIAPGYFTIEDIYVPVYSGITSVQPAEMLPLPENYQGDTTITYPETAPNL